MRLNGGLGNQMYQYAFGKALARRFGARLLMDRSLYKLPYVPERYRLNVFAIKPNFSRWHHDLMARALLSPKLSPVIKRAGASMAGMRIFDESKDCNAKYWRPDTLLPHISLARYNVFVGYWQRYRVFKDLLNELRVEFQIRLDQYDPSYDDYETKVQQTTSVAVHVRRGDYIANPEFRRSLGVLSTSYYFDAFELMSALLHKPTFFVFTDDVTWAREHFSRHAQTIVIHHFSGVGDLKDMRLMRSCKHFIIGNSSFSWWSAWLSEGEDKVVIAPKPWFIVDTISIDERLPTDWRLVDSRFL
jgi:hypothetical protein